MESFTIKGEYITLGQLLKEYGEIGSGGAAKAYLQSCPTYVDGDIETRRGRKLYPGMVVDLASGICIQLEGTTHEG